MSPANTVDLTTLPHHLGCNCQYPIALLGFIIITILALFVCVAVCCIDATKVRSHFALPCVMQPSSSNKSF
ncbi:unnamed protein product [Haemonchus placei]|uniref:Movement protein TGB2 n=1 Tax=Haemonchus placei TaxID=6290 RepID=A0A0N4WMG0_HAEPC|nr:unnamed protein product [Haemonchus placei]